MLTEDLELSFSALATSALNQARDATSASWKIMVYMGLGTMTVLKEMLANCG